MAKSKRNPPHNFTIKGGAIYLTGAKKKLSKAEEDQLRAALSVRYWNSFFQPFHNALRNYKNRRQSVTDIPSTIQEGNTHE